VLIVVKIQMIDRRRPKDEKELITRYKVFAKLQTAQDFEVLVEGLICEFFPWMSGQATC
jgi:transcriptional adapter 2-alpha